MAYAPTLRSNNKNLLLVGLLWIAATAEAELKISGLSSELEPNVRAYLGLDDVACDAPAWRINQAYENADEQIRKALEALGYYQSTLTKSINLSDKACWKSTIDIQPGAPTMIRNLEFSVAGDSLLEKALGTIQAKQALQKGSPLHHGHYSALKKSLIDEATRLGYFDATFTTARVDVFPGDHAADILLDMETGPRYRFGNITLEQDSLRPSLIADYLAIQQDAWYDAGLLRESYDNLSSSGYFKRVMVEPQLQQRADSLVPVLIQLEPAERRLMETGVGFATDTGPRLRGDLKYRRLNRAGHRSTSSLLLSPVLSTLTTSYEIPYGDPKKQWLVYDAGIQYENTDTSKSTQYGVGVRRTTTRWEKWIEALFIEGRFEDFEIGTQNGFSRLLMVGGSWSRTKAPSNLRPLRGQRFSLGVRGATKTLGSDTDFIQLTSAAKFIRSFAGFRMLLRLDGGTTFKDSLSDLPPSVRFFAGGDSSVRGYDYESLGPERDNEVVGGSFLLTGSFEVDHRIRKNWALALFVDAGSAFDQQPDFSVSAGVGLRWFSPVGPIRLDFAHPFHDERALRIHISLGPDL